MRRWPESGPVEMMKDSSMRCKESISDAISAINGPYTWLARTPAKTPGVHRTRSKRIKGAKCYVVSVVSIQLTLTALFVRMRHALKTEKRLKTKKKRERKKSCYDKPNISSRQKTYKDKIKF